jgi:hypothetical protein
MDKQEYINRHIVGQTYKLTEFGRNVEATIKQFQLNPEGVSKIRVQLQGWVTLNIWDVRVHAYKEERWDIHKYIVAGYEMFSMYMCILHIINDTLKYLNLRLHDENSEFYYQEQ